MSTTIGDLQSRMPGGAQALTPAQVSSISTEEARAVAQVQAGMTIAKRFPRDEQEAMTKALRTCAVAEFAEGAEYVFPRGGKSVRGASIRLLEEITRHWKNIEWSVMEITRDETAGQSLAQTYAVDLENNTWSRRQFIVPHRRDVSEGSKDLKSDRDIYEMVANMGSRRVRACLEGLIPQYVIDGCVKACRDTLAKRDKEKPLAQRIVTLVETFKTLTPPVTETQLSKWLKGRPVTEMRENEYQDLRAIGRSLKDGVARIEDHFEQATVADAMNSKRAAATPPKTTTPAPAAEPPAEHAAEKAAEPAAQPTPASGTTGTGAHTEATLLELIAQATKIDQLNGIGDLLKGANLTPVQTKTVRLASGKRAQAIQAEQRAKPTESSAPPEQTSIPE